MTDSNVPGEYREEPAALPSSPSFRTVSEAELSYVWNTLRRLGAPPSDLQDQSQEVFMLVGSLLADYDPTRPLRSWLFGITYRVAARYRTKVGRRREVIGDLPDIVDPLPDARDRIEHFQDQQLVLEAMDAIELPRRAIFVMAEIDGRTMPEIAETLALPLNTAYSRLRLARQEFERAVRRIRLRQESP